MDSNMLELGEAANKFANHKFMLKRGLRFGASFIKFLASFVEEMRFGESRNHDWRQNLEQARLMER
ncbi:hypothetical protein KSP40_PGU012194 [Platanthera guangdongensis]|uniref:Uncharacterized protein n=1 Tax=Platanthera guangdongensis TaxID=2320717 RepID=A0ABR2M2N9_9ASPA